MLKTDEENILRLFDSLSGYIESQTSAVCPSCEKVCCIDRHGTYEGDDIDFLNAIGVELAADKPKEVDTEPCRFLSERGCGLPRVRRPFRCTWYFCQPLLDAMAGGGARQYRRFVGELQELQRLRAAVLSR